MWLLRVQVGDDGEHAAVVVGGWRQAQGAEDVLDVLLDRVLGDEEPLGDRLLERPSAISASTSRSRSVRCSSGSSPCRRRPTSSPTTAGSSTEPPCPTRLTLEDELGEVGDALLEQVADAVGAGREQLERVAGVDVLREDEDPDRRPALRGSILAARRPSSV